MELGANLLISPSLALSIVPRILRRVVFPQPDGPLSITNSPLLIGYMSVVLVRLIFFRATIGSDLPLSMNSTSISLGLKVYFYPF